MLIVERWIFGTHWRIASFRTVFKSNAKAAAPSERELTSVVVADVVGYSRLTAEDEEGTLACLRELRSDLVDPAVARHRGRVVKTMGDGFLIEFLSVLDAVRSSLEIQHGLEGRKIGDASAPIRLRVGIHISDVLVEPDGDLLGDGINLRLGCKKLRTPGQSACQKTPTIKCAIKYPYPLSTRAISS